MHKTEKCLLLEVANTKHLLQLLDENKLDFAIIEGTFSKTKYDSYLCEWNRLWEFVQKTVLYAESIYRLRIY